MTRQTLLDTGPLVAAIDRRDRFHDWAVEQWGHVAPPALTCEAVLSEACFLLRHCPQGVRALGQLVQQGLIRIPFRLEDEAHRVVRLLAKYSAVPMSLANACLVRMAEIYPEGVVLTVDSDFRVYRKHGRQVVPVILPEGA